ncbi:MAG: putative ABC transporter permease [Lachnospiraceae bacterium]|nr:putative ABC transporter permease [Lachnospiraceae bacterium]
MKKAYLTLTEYVCLFALASFIGWLYEVTLVWALLGQYIDRGVLHLPFCPIYGFGMLFLLLLFRKVRNPFALFFGSALVTTGIELAASYILEYAFGLVLWTYEGWPLNFENRVTAISSSIFGLMALVFIRLIRPPVRKIYASKAAGCAAAAVSAGFVFCVIWELTHR